MIKKSLSSNPPTQNVSKYLSSPGRKDLGHIADFIRLSLALPPTYNTFKTLLHTHLLQRISTHAMPARTTIPSPYLMAYHNHILTWSTPLPLPLPLSKPNPHPGSSSASNPPCRAPNTPSTAHPVRNSITRAIFSSPTRVAARSTLHRIEGIMGR